MLQKLNLVVKLAVVMILVALFSSAVSAQKVEHQHHKAAVGIHGMAVFTDGSKFYASHMPLANSIHAHQVIFSFTLEPKTVSKLRQMLEQNALVSLNPERFDLMELMSGKLTSFKGSLVEGHFERGGKTALTKVTINVSEMLLTADLPTNTDENGQFFLIKTGDGSGLLVHRIVESPSFDQIVQVAILSEPAAKHTNTPAPLLTITSGQAIEMSKPEIKRVEGYEIKLASPLYLETRDFQ